MTNGVIRQHGVSDITGFQADRAVRPEVTAEHLRYVDLNRHRLGWQTMANICGVNQTDLRRRWEAARGGVTPPTMKPPPAKALDAAHTVRAGSQQLRALAAIAAGASDRHMVAAKLGITAAHAATLGSQLQRKELMHIQWRLSDRGRVELQRHGAAHA
jgi:hypothetical protein